jgi:hypothetical protein
MRTAPNDGAVAQAKADQGKRHKRRALDSPQPASASSPKQLLADLDAARERCAANLQIMDWIVELRAKVWRAEEDLLHHDCGTTLRDLQTEWERFKLTVSLAKKARRS